MEAGHLSNVGIGQPLGASRVTVYTREAFEFVQQLPEACYHVVIGGGWLYYLHQNPDQES